MDKIIEQFVILKNRNTLTQALESGRIDESGRYIVFLKEERLIWTHGIMFGEVDLLTEDDVNDIISNNVIINEALEQIKSVADKVNTFDDLFDNALEKIEALTTAVNSLEDRIPVTTNLVQEGNRNPITSNAVYVTRENLREQIRDLYNNKLNKSDFNIKTINNESLKGTGNISIPVVNVDNRITSTSNNPVSSKAINEALNSLQDDIDFLESNMGDTINNIVNEAINNITLSKEHSKGFFSSLESLIAKVDQPEVGDWAIVETEDGWYIYTYNGTEWEKGSVYERPNITSEDIDAIYAKKTDIPSIEGLATERYVDDKIHDIEDDIDSIQQEVDNRLSQYVKIDIYNSSISNLNDHINTVDTDLQNLKNKVDDLPQIVVDDVVDGKTNNPISNSAVYKALQKINESLDKKANLSDVITKANIDSYIRGLYDDIYVRKDEVYTPDQSNAQPVDPNSTDSGSESGTGGNSGTGSDTNEWTFGNTFPVTLSGSGSSTGGSSYTIDYFLSTTSNNPVANRIIATALNEIREALKSKASVSDIPDMDTILKDYVKNDDFDSFKDYVENTIVKALDSKNEDWIEELITSWINDYYLNKEDLVKKFNTIDGRLDVVEDEISGINNTIDSKIQDRLSGIGQIKIQVVESISDVDTNKANQSTIYLVGPGESSTYIEYLWSGSEWIEIGTRTMDINLEEYATTDYVDIEINKVKEDVVDSYTKDEVDDKLKDYWTSGQISNKLKVYYTKDEVYTKDQVDNTLNQYVKTSQVYTPEQGTSLSDSEIDEPGYDPHSKVVTGDTDSYVTWNAMTEYIANELSNTSVTTEGLNGIIIEESNLDQATINYKNNSVYFVLEGEKSNWTFGDAFPIIF